MTGKILLVDDEQYVLDALKITLRREFDPYTALGGAEGLELIERDGPFAVVVSDYKMPGMNGVEFLERLRKLAPDCVRVILTGHGDLNAAIAAVNQGEIFRFLTKPCPTSVLCEVLRDGLAKYRRDSFIAKSDGSMLGVLGVSVSKAQAAAPDFCNARLTPRERSIAGMIRRGDSTKQIALVMSLSPRTVETYRDNIRKKLGIANKKINLQSYLSSGFDSETM
ncbi:response regulator [Desulfovibrio aerotolerans]|uniref:Response regulator n=1 Tax=Solidesulfovibrio aerotolerans TaxID=295255 RepID=A0A7C9IML0_9BACT|nr:response regulator [Solidesulfovibrio aerotolerans]MYL84064.1 response regulator [Solidesulfovibrio aerotolerans]